MLYTREQYKKLDFALRRAGAEIILLDYHNERITSMMKEGIQDIRWLIKGDTEELRHIKDLCKSEQRLNYRYAQMIIRKAKMVKESLMIIPEPRLMRRAYRIFGRLEKRIEEAFQDYLEGYK